MFGFGFYVIFGSKCVAWWIIGLFDYTKCGAGNTLSLTSHKISLCYVVGNHLCRGVVPATGAEDYLFFIAGYNGGLVFIASFRSERVSWHRPDIFKQFPYMKRRGYGGDYEHAGYLRLFFILCNGQINAPAMGRAALLLLFIAILSNCWVYRLTTEN